MTLLGDVHSRNGVRIHTVRRQERFSNLVHFRENQHALLMVLHLVYEEDISQKHSDNLQKKWSISLYATKT